MAVAIWSVGSLQGRQSERAEKAPYAYKDTAKADAERVCVSGAPSEVFECVYDKVETSHQTAHDEQDLFAQELAAWSAMTAAGVGAATLAISVLGLLYIRDTLVETRKAVRQTVEANEISERTAERQLRAYVAVRPEGVVQLIRNNNLIGMICIENVGQIPAKNIEVFMDMRCSSSKTETDFSVKIGRTGSDLSIQPRTTIRKGTPPKRIGKEVEASGKYVYVFGVVIYADEFKPQRRTEFCHRYATISRRQNPSDMFLVRMGETGEDRTIFDPKSARFHFSGNDAT